MKRQFRFVFPITVIGILLVFQGSVKGCGSTYQQPSYWHWMMETTKKSGASVDLCQLRSVSCKLDLHQR